MKKPLDTADFLASRAEENNDFRRRLLSDPRRTIELELGVTLDEGHEIHVHEDSYAATHVVLPPRDRLSRAEREEARTGAESLEFLRRTMHDPAPPARPATPGQPGARRFAGSPDALAKAGRESVRRGLAFLKSNLDESGAWRCIRFNIADPNIPRHFERPPFVSALCILALESSKEALAKAIRSTTRRYIEDTVEHPGFWRYYLHLPQDLDSTTLCSLAIDTHPWIVLGRNVPRILANRDEEGRFMTWVLEEDQPDVVSRFRLEADPVVNANVIAYLGDNSETRNARRWLETLVSEGSIDGTSKWYPDTVTIYYSISRAMARVRPALDQLRPTVADHVLGLRDQDGEFGNVLLTAQAVSALDNIGHLASIDAAPITERLIDSQREDGSWPELLAFGDQSLKFGLVGQIGHGSEAVTSAFCIEALERLVDSLEN